MTEVKNSRLYVELIINIEAQPNIAGLQYLYVHFCLTKKIWLFVSSSSVIGVKGSGKESSSASTDHP